ncbi:MAG TPA: serine hydrolase domain-containing protein, partial [Acidimicrobiales bacterium]|nr:serine hydrolase domain-containing protein [Acidimicrobiales bacterium]
MVPHHHQAAALADFPAVRRVLEQSSVVVAGLQLDVRAPSQRLSVAAGIGAGGSAMEATTSLPVGCVGKPLLAASFLRRLFAAGLSVDAPLSAVIPQCNSSLLARVQLRRLLHHDAGLDNYFAPYIFVHPRERWDELALGYDWSHVASEFRLSAAYSEFVAFHLLALAAERTFAEPLLSKGTIAWLRSRGCAADVGRPAEGSGDDHIWLAGRWRATKRPDVVSGHVVYDFWTSARSMCRFYSVLLNALRDSGSELHEVARSMTSDRRGPKADRGLGRECDFGLGVMVDLAHHLV